MKLKQKFKTASYSVVKLFVSLSFRCADSSSR